MELLSIALVALATIVVMMGVKRVPQGSELESSIINGSGRVKVGDSTWKANGPDCEVGCSVRVISLSGSELNVEIV